jgi:hypothetical protein
LLLLKSCQTKLRTLQAHNAAHLRASETNVRSELRACLLSAKRLLERRLRTLRCAFKALCPHLRSGSSLLLHNVSLQFLLRNRLARSAKSARADRLCPQPCARDIAFAPNICQSLLHRCVFKFAHKRLNAARVVKIAGSGQRTYSPSRYASRHLTSAC